MQSPRLSFLEKIHYSHRFLRYRFRTEPDTVQFIKEEFDRGGTALDIGANKGIVTWFLGKQAGADGHVIAFEPQPEMKEQIAKVANTWALGNVAIHSIGISDENKKATLYRGNPGETASLAAGTENWQTSEIQIELQTLDTFCRTNSITRLDFVKCDVDGHETEVLRGAENTLRKHQPKILIEAFENELPAVIEILRGYGYDDGVFLFEGKRYPSEETSTIQYRHPHSRWRNFLFCQKP